MRTACLLTFAVLLGTATGCRNESTQLLSDLTSSNVVVRQAAIVAVGDGDVKESIPTLRGFLVPPSPRQIRLSSVKALGSLAAKDAVPDLTGILKEPDSEIRIAAVEALGRIRDARAVTALGELLDDPDAQLAAIWAMGNIGGKDAIPLITPLLSAEDKFVRYNASMALKRIGNGS